MLTLIYFMYLISLYYLISLLPIFDDLLLISKKDFTFHITFFLKFVLFLLLK